MEQAADYAWELGLFDEADALARRLTGVERGRSLLYQGKNAEALEALEAAGDDNVEAWAPRAQAAQRLGRFDDAARWARRASEAEPRDPRLWAEAARNLVLAGRLDEARVLAQAGLAAHPGQPDLEIQLGYVRLLSGDDTKAEAIALGRNRFGDDGGRHHFASPYRDDGRSRYGEDVHEPEYERLKGSLREAAAEPGRPHYQDALAKAWIKSNQIMCVLIGQARYGDAADLGHQTLTLADAPQFSWEWVVVINQIQQAYCRDRRFGEAAKLLEDALARAEAEGTSREVRAKLALSLAHTHLNGRPTWPLADRWARRAVEIQGPGFGGSQQSEPTFSHDVAQAFVIMGKLDDAETAFRRALAFEKRLPYHARTISAQVGLGQVLAAKGRRPEAETLCRRVLAGWNLAANPVTLVNALKTLAQICPPAEASRLLEDALRRFETGADEASVLARTQKDPSPDHLADVMRLLGQTALKNGRKDQAKDWYDKAISRAKQTRPPLAPEIEAEAAQGLR